MNRYALPGAIAALALLLVFLASRLFVESVECVYAGRQGEAQRNDHLAAERFLQRTGFSVQQLRGLDGFQRMPAQASLLWSRAPSEGERERLVQWVKGGGHLIFAAPFAQENLMREIGVQIADSEAAEDEEDQADEADNAAQEGEAAASDSAPQKSPEQAPPASQAAELRGEACTKQRGAPWKMDADVPLIVSAGEAQFELLLPSMRLESTGAPQHSLRAANDEEGAVMLEQALGRGRITVLTSGYLLSNDWIGKHDHAAWLRYLVAPPAGVTNPQVWFADVPLAASLWQWLKLYAWPVLLAGAICIALGLWRALARFGPLLPDEAPGRLSFRDHLVACGRFLWRHGAAGGLLHNVEQEAQRAESGAAASTTAPVRTLLGRAGEAPALVQRLRALQRRLSAKKTLLVTEPTLPKDAS